MPHSVKKKLIKNIFLSFYKKEIIHCAWTLNNNV